MRILEIKSGSCLRELNGSKNDVQQKHNSQTELTNDNVPRFHPIVNSNNVTPLFEEFDISYKGLNLGSAFYMKKVRQKLLISIERMFCHRKKYLILHPLGKCLIRYTLRFRSKKKGYACLN